jgi:hypothetical protein
MCSDYETYISADDLRINLWNLEVSDQSFSIVDIKPTNMEDLPGILSDNVVVAFSSGISLIKWLVGLVSGLDL